MRRSTGRLAGLAAVLALAAPLACGETNPPEVGSVQPQGGQLKLTLGTKNFTESVILGELYAQALGAKGYQVVLRKNVGPTEEIDQALQEGEIDAYPEYLGVAATVVVGEDVEGRSAEETSRLARDYYAERGQAISEETPYENVDALATTFLYAQENRLSEIGDLRSLDSFRLGGRPEFEEREQGLAGLQRVYELTNAEFVPLDIGATYVALDNGDVDVVNVFSTDAALSTGEYKLLDDPDRVFGHQHVALVVDEDQLGVLGGEKFMAVVDDVSRRLTQDTMIGLNRAVDIDGREPADVAERFLREAGLLTSGD